MKLTSEIKAYFDAKSGSVDSIDNVFANDIRIEDTGENTVINGFDNCKKWLEEKNQQYKMETTIVDIQTEKTGKIKVSVLVSGNFAIGNFPFDYYFIVTDGKIKDIKIVYIGK
jgi:hypothetical protein